MILVLTAYDFGADEVWEMPKRIEEAVAKGNAIIRRYLEFNKEIDRQSTFIVNKRVILSTEQRLVYIKGIRIELTKIEFDILALLMTHPGKVFTYEYIYCEVWGDALTDTAKDILHNQVYKLREKMEP